MVGDDANGVSASSELSVELEKQYQAALNEIRVRFNGNGRAAEAYFEKLFKSSTFLRREFFQSRFKNSTCKTTATAKLAVIAAVGKLPQHSLASQVLKRITRTDDELPLTDKCDGFYRYWRYYPTQQQDLDPVRWGVIELRTNQNTGTTFNHWSYDEIGRRELLNDPPNWCEFKDPEDSGFGFFSTRRRMFLMAFRVDNIRLGIASLIENLKTDVANGVVLTTRKGSGAVFAAGFVMAHESTDITRKPMRKKEFLTYIKMERKNDLFILCD